MILNYCTFQRIIPIMSYSCDYCVWLCECNILCGLIPSVYVAGLCGSQIEKQNWWGNKSKYVKNKCMAINI